jgi:hypothetical protein
MALGKNDQKIYVIPSKNIVMNGDAADKTALSDFDMYCGKKKCAISVTT